MWVLLATISIVCLSEVSCITPTPEPELQSIWPTEIFPGEECLPYDGSVVPDCSEFVDPVDKIPYYHQHSENCSRFWECGPELETCLVACAPCPCLALPPDQCNFQCEGKEGYQWALTFDEVNHNQPTCVWPINYDGSCSNKGPPCDCLPWQTCINGVCSPQCKNDTHCPDGYYCDDCNWCVPDNSTGCANTDSNCPGFDALCNIPAHDNCFWCNGTNCEEGCSSDANCPHDRPSCGGNGDHRCGCSGDGDCPDDLPVCDTSGGDHQCVPRPSTTAAPTTTTPGCIDNDGCGSCVTKCQPPDYSMCHYCDVVNAVCEEGCCSNDNCPDEFPTCGNGIDGGHTCGCSEDWECKHGLYCDPDHNQCVHQPGIILLDSINIYSTSCTGCTTEGVIVYLIGEKNGDSPNGVVCDTHILDHKGKVDYSSGRAVFDGRRDDGSNDYEEIDMMGGCHMFGLNAVLTNGGNVTWDGAGTWEPQLKAGICIDWRDEDEYVWTCDLTGSAPVWNLGNCVKLSSDSCP